MSFIYYHPVAIWIEQWTRGVNRTESIMLTMMEIMCPVNKLLKRCLFWTKMLAITFPVLPLKFQKKHFRKGVRCYFRWYLDRWIASLEWKCLPSHFSCLTQVPTKHVKSREHDVNRCWEIDKFEFEQIRLSCMSLNIIK